MHNICGQDTLVKNEVIKLTFDDKVRLRTKEELLAQNEGLILIKNILEKIGVTYYLSSGTLLGAVREKDFIPWDWDVQMYLTMENAYPLRDKITNSFINNSFIIHKFNDNNDSLKWDVRRNGIIFELTAWYLKGEWRYRKEESMRVPAYLFDGYYNINFKGINYRTLNPPEEYLKFCYGDWKTQKRTSRKDIYSNSNHLRNLKTSNKIKLYFKKIYLKFFN